MPAIVGQWKRGKLCDAKIMAGGVSFQAQRSVLAAASPYFEGLYCGEAGEAMNGGDAGGAHVLEQVSPTALDVVLSFIYEGKCIVPNQDHLVPTLEAADFLGVLPLRDAVASAITDRLSADNCVAAFQLSERYDMNDFRRLCLAACARNFCEIARSGAPSLDLMRTLVRSVSLPARSEECVFEAVSAWWDAQPDPKPDLSQGESKSLLRYILVELLPPEFVRDIVLRAGCMQTVEARDVVIECLLYKRLMPRVRVRYIEVVDNAETEYTWSIPNWSQRGGCPRDDTLFSPVFKLGSVAWRLAVREGACHPREDSEPNGEAMHAAVMLADRFSLPPGWSCEKRFKITLLHPTSSNNVDKIKTKVYSLSHKDLQYQMVRSTEAAAFCVDDTLQIRLKQLPLKAHAGIAS